MMRASILAHMLLQTMRLRVQGTARQESANICHWQVPQFQFKRVACLPQWLPNERGFDASEVIHSVACSCLYSLDEDGRQVEELVVERKALHVGSSHCDAEHLGGHSGRL